MKLLNKKNSISDFLRKLRNPSLLILDYDGTLAPFNKIREAAFPYEGVVERLHQLLNLKNTRVVVVSGRSIQDMYHLLPSGLELWGSYGFQKRSAEGKEENMPLDQTCREGLQLAQNLCQNVVSDEHLELKPYSLAVHWRGAEQSKEMLKSVGALW
jgi:trehalose 6-phosphate phosphatase